MDSPSTLSIPPSLRKELDDHAQALYNARKAAVDNREVDLDEYTRRLVAEEESLVEAITTDGYDLLGIGAARVVFALPTDIGDESLVVKFPRFGGEAETSDGLIQNGYERDLFARATDTQRLALVPVVAHANSRPWWTVMPRVTPLEDANRPDDEKRKRLMTFLMDVEELGLAEHLHMADISNENTAVYNGNLRVFDYGHRALDIDVTQFDSELDFEDAVENERSDE